MTSFIYPSLYSEFTWVMHYQWDFMFGHQISSELNFICQLGFISVLWLSFCLILMLKVQLVYSYSWSLWTLWYFLCSHYLFIFMICMTSSIIHGICLNYFLSFVMIKFGHMPFFSVGFSLTFNHVCDVVRMTTISSLVLVMLSSKSVHHSARSISSEYEFSSLLIMELMMLMSSTHLTIAFFKCLGIQ